MGKYMYGGGTPRKIVNQKTPKKVTKALHQGGATFVFGRTDIVNPIN
jgi:hypothetical protein